MRTLKYWIAILAVAMGGLYAACSNNSQGNGLGGEGMCSAQNANALTILFSPMYSAFEPMHTYQVPAVVDGIKANVQWTVSDPSAVGLQPDPSTGGVMITVLKAGTITLTAQAGDLCGSSTLNVTQAAESDWEIGNARYNNGVALHFGRRDADGGMPMGMMDGGNVAAACTNCHGATAMSGPFRDIAHTPEQTGGFSDQDLIDIVINGVVPDGGYFDNAILPYDRWQRIHTWSDIQEDQKLGMIVYLRSITPTSQTGSVNFGGRGRHDAGVSD